MKIELAALYHLQQIDTELAILQKNYALLDRGAVEQERRAAAVLDDDAAQAAFKSNSAEQLAADLELKSVEAKREETEKKLYSGTVRVAKELQALQDEIDMLDRRRSTLDEKLLKLMDTVETQRLNAEATKARRKAADSALRQKKQHYKVHAEAMVKQARELAIRRARAAQHIPAELLKRYDAIRAARAGLGIVPLVDGNACGGCHMALPSTFVREVRAAETVATCQNCGRIVTEKPVVEVEAAV